MKNRGTVFSYHSGKWEVTVYWIKPPDGVQAPLQYGFKVEDGDSEVWAGGIKTLPEARRLAACALSSS